MLLSLGCHLSIAVVGQLFLVNIYELTAVEIGAPMGPDFFTHALHGVRTFGVIMVLSVSGIWLIKLNFLLFFYRLGNQITVYRIMWWICFVFSIGCGVGCFGVIQYSCMFGNMETTFNQCARVYALRETYIRVIMTAVFDIVSDFASESSPARYQPPFLGEQNTCANTDATIQFSGSLSIFSGKSKSLYERKSFSLPCLVWLALRLRSPSSGVVFSAAYTKS